jgi:hypothetical protein
VSARKPEDPSPDEVVEELRAVRERARKEQADRPALAPYAVSTGLPAPLPPIETRGEERSISSPPREELNELWDLTPALAARSPGLLGKWFSPLRSPLQRLIRFALGAALERQIAMNSAQVRFDNELVRYLDERLDRMSRHYDEVLGLHGRRMGEIDERHLILQQELVRHVHDLVERIEFVFEAAEQNHLYLEGMLRENREELERLSERLSSLARNER